ncbi:MAG: Uma2 family endonuclease [Gomphosphaeria aponina SAG 52.96 = DSM 107014]|uniref:Uma2 family endonuclease n=1 Tax=Gomphosphaeria aponina SAG 52.96 = DSM 107014 TaxID=1521640 RepID=A0A941GSG8_9CHRO|nr:Uma2 family endonuclease [Gomphosphaeria aponina SAG 52.96 = DSM 107014]
MQLLTRKFTIKDYYKMAESGILTESDRVELIRGEIVEMSPISPKHAACVIRLNAILSEKLRKRALRSIQNPIQLDDTSEPQPDVVLLKNPIDTYRKRLPQPADIFLIIEVADTSVKYDREVKIPLYAEANIPEVWLVDVNNNCVEMYRQPTANGYQNMQKFTGEESLSILAFPDVIIKVNEII